METTNYPPTAPATTRDSSCHGGGQTPGGWFSRQRTLILAGGVIVAVIVLALNQHWIAAATLTPLLYVLPCALIMFMCMKGMHHDQQTGATQPAANTDQPADTRAIPG